MNHSSKPTIRDIARMAGVSRSTVSLVINDDPRISSETKSKVLRVIQEAGFEPNSMARRLARRRADTIGVVLPATAPRVFADLYFAEAISGISSVLSEAGFRLLIEIAGERFLDRLGHFKLIREGAVDGLLILGATTEDAYIGELMGTQARVVLVNSYLPGVAAVVADNRHGSREMVAHLASLGHRRIGFIGGLEITTSGEERSRGFLEGLQEQGIPFHDELRLWGNFSEESGAQVARTLLERSPRPTAIMAANDMMAIGAMRVAQKEFGLRIPEDLTVVGADDVQLTTYVTPRLTTISQPIFEIGRLATRALLDALRRGSHPQGVQTVQTRLVVRESSGPPANRVAGDEAVSRP